MVCVREWSAVLVSAVHGRRLVSAWGEGLALLRRCLCVALALMCRRYSVGPWGFLSSRSVREAARFSMPLWCPGTSEGRCVLANCVWWIAVRVLVLGEESVCKPLSSNAFAVRRGLVCYDS